MARIKVELVKYHTQQVKFTGDEITRLVLQFLCETASRFENTVLYSVRRDYFEKNQEFYIAPGRNRYKFCEVGNGERGMENRKSRLHRSSQ